jgi:hypothetical protein
MMTSHQDARGNAGAAAFLKLYQLSLIRHAEG